MKKEKLFIILTLLTAFTFFTTAATCNYCGIYPAKTTISEESAEMESESEEKTEETTSKEINEEITEEATEETSEEASEESESTAEESTSESIEEYEVPPDEIISIFPDADLSGSVWKTGPVNICSITNDPIIVWDSDENVQVKGFLSFDIRELHGKTAHDAEIIFKELYKVNNPEFAEYIDVKAVNYGNTLDSDDFEFGGVRIGRIPTSSSHYTISGETLKNELQKVFDSAETDYFQIKLGLSSKTNNDGIMDGFNISLEDVWLYIFYID